MNETKPILLGIDTGGTFTDFVLFDGDDVRVHKVLSTPQAPERAILDGIKALGLKAEAARIVHGSTVATNAVLEGKGVHTVFITNRGFKDLLTIGRQNRARLYDLQPPVVAPPVPARDCLETGGRLDAQGEVIEPLSQDDLDALKRRLAERAPRAVAVCLLFSFLDAELEQRIAEIVPADCFVSLSSAVLPRMGEYERGIATWLNAYVGPLVAGYVNRLREALPRTRLALMQSQGRTVAAQQAAERAVHLLLSGPAGGLAGARFVGQLAGTGRLITLDMGGTSTDVALIDGDIQRTTEGRIGRYPVAVPMVDLHTIGAGGGSIARVDAGGLLQVGPESAGAEPGPACYGRGGQHATVTDANLVLGRLPGSLRLGGTLKLDLRAAQAALAALGRAMGTDSTGAAAGVIQLAGEHMAQALRVISVERGHDPADYVLMSFGGAGGLHVCQLAEQLGMRQALVPPQAGVLSALGMLAAVPGRELAAARLGLLDGSDEEAIARDFQPLVRRGERELAAEGQAPQDLHVERLVDLRYRGQTHTLTLPWRGALASARAFHAAHQRRFGHHLDAAVELVNLRVVLTGRAAPLHLPEIPKRPRARPYGETLLADLGRPAPVWERAALGRGQTLSGPAVITEPVGTTYLPPGWGCTMTSNGAMVLTGG